MVEKVHSSPLLLDRYRISPQGYNAQYFKVPQLDFDDIRDESTDDIRHTG